MTALHMPSLRRPTPRVYPARWGVRMSLTRACMCAVLCILAWQAHAAPSSKSVRTDPPKHTEGDIGQLPAEVQAVLQRAKVPSENFHVDGLPR